MAKSRRRHIVHSHEEYLSEEHIVQENTLQQHVAPSEQERSSDVGEGNEDVDDDFDVNVGEDNEDTDDDVDIVVQDEKGATARRGKTKLKDVWNLPKGLRIVVECNDLNQAVGEEAGILSNFLGMIARNGSLCSLSYTDWRYLVGKREKNTNELKVKKDILKQVKMRFLYVPRMEEFILKKIGERWREYKAKLKKEYFDVNKSKEANCNNVPTGVLPDQWIALVNHWMSKKSKKISDQNKENCQKKKALHTAGTKSFARNREELRQKDPDKKNPHRAVLYIHTHQHGNNKNINGHVENLKKLLVEQPCLADTSQGRTAWKGDALNKILGDDKPGRVHGLGLVPKPKQVLDLPTSRRLQHINLTALDDNSSEDAMAVRLQMERFQNHVQNHDAELLELKEKTKKLEKAHINQRCLDQVAAKREDICVDGPNSKRRRVYGDHPFQSFMAEEQSNVVEQGNNIMSTRSHVQDKDMQQLTKNSSVDKDKQYLGQNDSGKQRKAISSAYKKKESLDHNDHRKRGKNVSSSFNNKKASKQDNHMMNAQNKENFAHTHVRLGQNKYTTAPKSVHDDGLLQQICTVEHENSVMNTNSQAQDNNLQPSTNHATTDKTLSQIDQMKQTKVIGAKKRQCSSMDFIKDNSIEVDKINA